MRGRRVIVIDQTIREGMQYRGLMFSLGERLKILEFQESLGVDISQSAYPPAHESEAFKIRQMRQETEIRGYNIHVAPLSRALVADVKQMVEYGLIDFHLHTSVTADMLKRQRLEQIFTSLEETILFIRANVKGASIEVSMLDIGKTDMGILEKSAKYLIDTLKIDILSLPDTSGVMCPNQFFDRVKYIFEFTKDKKTLISVHCHNDLGMATGNTIMGVIAGAGAMGVGALGIGERNGIGDLFITGKCLKDQGFSLNLKTENIDLFREYYEYVDELCFKKTGINLLNYNTPFFGEGIKTHVAGTHALGKFGVSSKEEYFLNVLCGKNLVEKYLNSNNIKYQKNDLKKIVAKIKDKSVEMKCCLTIQDVEKILENLKYRS